MTAGTVFQRVINQILQRLQYCYVAMYIDYITVYSTVLEQHWSDLENLIHRLDIAFLQLSVSKNRLAQESILVLGHHVFSQEIELYHIKMTSILQFPEVR